MTKQTNWFKVIAVVFAVVLAYVSYDISRRTTFPGSKPQLKERIQKNFFHTDSSKKEAPIDTLLEHGNDSAKHVEKLR